MCVSGKLVFSLWSWIVGQKRAEVHTTYMPEERLSAPVSTQLHLLLPCRLIRIKINLMFCMATPKCFCRCVTSCIGLLVFLHMNPVRYVSSSVAQPTNKITRILTSVVNCSHTNGGWCSSLLTALSCHVTSINESTLKHTHLMYGRTAIITKASNFFYFITVFSTECL